MNQSANPIRWYGALWHGTSSVHLDDIMERGLLPAQHTGIYTFGIPWGGVCSKIDSVLPGERRRSVYFTGSDSGAVVAACSCAVAWGGLPVVILFDLPMELRGLIKLDEAGGELNFRLQRAVPPEFVVGSRELFPKSEWRRLEPKWRRGIEEISPWWIDRVASLARERDAQSRQAL